MLKHWPAQDLSDKPPCDLRRKGTDLVGRLECLQVEQHRNEFVQQVLDIVSLERMLCLPQTLIHSLKQGFLQNLQSAHHRLGLFVRLDLFIRCL